MKTVKKPSVIDERGELYEFTGVCAEFKQVNILFSKAGTKRGQHYHKILREKFYIISGFLIVDVVNVETGEKTSFECKKAEQFIIEPFNQHTLTFIEDTTILSFYSEEFDPINPDIYSL